MKFFCSLCLGLLISLNCSSQINISLRPEAFFSSTATFYIINVVDSTLQKSLGMVNQKSLYLLPNKAEGVQKFLQFSFPKREEALPVTLKINTFSVQKSQTGASELTARIHLDLTFLDTSGQVLYQISHNEDEVFDEFSENEILRTHEKRIRAGLEYCMRKFYIQLQQPDLDWRVDYSNNLADEFRLPKWHNMLTFKRVYSKHTEGWRIAYSGFVDRTDDFILPFVFSFDQVRLKPDVLINSKIKSIDTYALGTGFNGYLKLFNGFYVGVGLEVPIGVEVYRDMENRKRSNFLIGANIKEGILIMPWQDLGVVAGLNFFQNFQTSKVYQTNFGFEWEVGFNF